MSSLLVLVSNPAQPLRRRGEKEKTKKLEREIASMHTAMAKARAVFEHRVLATAEGGIVGQDQTGRGVLVTMAVPVSVREEILKAMDEANASETVVFTRYSTVEERRQAEYAASELMRLSPRLIELVREGRIQSLGVEVQR